MEELNTLLAQIEQAEERLGGVQAQVLALAEFKRDLETAASSVRRATEEALRLEREARDRTAAYERLLSEMQQQEQSLLARLEKLQQLEARLEPTIAAAGKISEVVAHLPDLETRVGELTGQYSAAQMLNRTLTQLVEQAGVKSSDLERVDARLERRAAELRDIEARAADILSAVADLRNASETCTGLEGRVRRLNEGLSTLENSLNRVGQKFSGGRDRRWTM